MKASAFAYARATSVVDALELLATHGDKARILSGGQSLMPAMNLRLISPELIVDIGELAELRGITVRDDVLTIGALTRHVDLLKSPEIAAHAPLAGGCDLPCRPSRDPQSRHDRWQPCACGSGLRIAGLHAGAGCDHHRSRTARRTADSRAANSSPASTKRRFRRRNCWSLSSCRWRARDSVHFFHEFARRHGDYAIVGLAAQAIVKADRFADLRLGFFAVGDRPLLAEAAGKLVDVAVTPAVLSAASFALDERTRSAGGSAGDTCHASASGEGVADALRVHAAFSPRSPCGSNVRDGSRGHFARRQWRAG